MVLQQLEPFPIEYAAALVANRSISTFGMRRSPPAGAFAFANGSEELDEESPARALSETCSLVT